MAIAKSSSLILSLFLIFFDYNAAETIEDILAPDGKGSNRLKKQPVNPGRDTKLSSYSLTLDVDPNAGSTSSFLITVFWNNEIYQSTLEQPTSGTITFDAFGSFVMNDYNYLSAAGTKAKMLIQNNDNDDAAIFSSMMLTLEDGTYYGIDGFCGERKKVGNYYKNFRINDNECDAEGTGLTHYDAVCVDGNPGLECNPSNLMVVFDKRNPNTVTNTALIKDSTNKVIEGCQLLVSPMMAEKCAKKSRSECDSARSCNLVSETFGTGPVPAYYERETRENYVSHNNVIGFSDNKEMIPEYVLLGFLAISGVMNVYFCFYRGGKMSVFM